MEGRWPRLMLADTALSANRKRETTGSLVWAGPARSGSYLVTTSKTGAQVRLPPAHSPRRSLCCRRQQPPASAVSNDRRPIPAIYVPSMAPRPPVRHGKQPADRGGYGSCLIYAVWHAPFAWVMNCYCRHFTGHDDPHSQPPRPPATPTRPRIMPAIPRPQESSTTAPSPQSGRLRECSGCVCHAVAGPRKKRVREEALLLPLTGGVGDSGRGAHQPPPLAEVLKIWNDVFKSPHVRQRDSS